MNQTEKLIAYCLGAISIEDREIVEENLIQSQDWIREFISIKRSLESNEMFQVEPSINLQKKLRLDIESTFLKKTGNKISHIESRPRFKIFLLKPALGAAFAAILLVVLSSFFGHHAEPLHTEVKNGISVDAVNQSPLNNSFL